MFHFSYHVVIACVVMHEHLFLYTLIRSILTILDSHVQNFFGHLLILFRCSCDRTHYEELKSFFIIGILALLFMLFSDSIYIASSCHFLSFIHLSSLC